MYIDSHAHLSSPDVLPQIDGVMERASAAKVNRIVNICTDETTLKEGLVLNKRFPFIYNAAAATPHDVEKIGEQFFPLVKKAAEGGDLIAIGETGLDYHYEHSNRTVQQEHLLRYFELAKQVKLPIIFHCRDAFKDLFALADKHYAGGSAVLHCFTGNEEESKGVIERGWYLSVSGIATFKKSESLRKAVELVPLDRILTETDTPYLAPQSKRGKPNEPSYMVETVQMLAGLFGKSLEEMARITSANADQFFSFSKRP
ncbi:MAG: TatD family hydrolase [Verrucomicrobia bacterium]|nr:TatD family hydrolase [Verrucomicrobiota bacterium]